MTAPDPTAGEPNIVQRIVNAWDCCGTCAGGVLARHMADQKAAARTEERERIAQAIEAERDLDPRTPFGLGLASAAQIAREAR
jgi:hypothetical protein